MKILGIDWGERHLGLALSSEDGAWAFPWKTENIRGFSHAMQVITQIVQAEKVGTVVIGLPLGMNGKDTPQTSRVREVVADLANLIPIPVEMVDERLTTQTAVRLQHDGDRHANTPNDTQAAVAILQTYLDQHRP